MKWKETLHFNELMKLVNISTAAVNIGWFCQVVQLFPLPTWRQRSFSPKMKVWILLNTPTINAHSSLHVPIFLSPRENMLASISILILQLLTFIGAALGISIPRIHQRIVDPCTGKMDSCNPTKFMGECCILSNSGLVCGANHVVTIQHCANNEICVSGLFGQIPCVKKG